MQMMIQIIGEEGTDYWCFILIGYFGHCWLERAGCWLWSWVCEQSGLFSVEHSNSYGGSQDIGTPSSTKFVSGCWSHAASQLSEPSYTSSTVWRGQWLSRVIGRLDTNSFVTTKILDSSCGSSGCTPSLRHISLQNRSDSCLCPDHSERGQEGCSVWYGVPMAELLPYPGWWRQEPKWKEGFLLRV